MSKGNFSKVFMVGNLGHKPELRHTAKGNPVVTLSVATSRNWRDEEGTMTEETQWHRITIWGRKAEIVAQYLETGSRVFLEGQLQIKNWTDKDGIIRKSVEVQADEIRFLGGGPRRVETAVETEEETEIPAIA